MIENPQGLFNSRSSTREFLLNKTETEKREDRFGEISPTILKDLSRPFPDLRFGPSFLDHTLEKLEGTANFGAMAIRMDHRKASEEDKDPESTGIASRIDILKRIETVCKKRNGIWGLMDNDLFGLFLPEMGDKICLEAATSLRSSLAKRKAGTVTIGIAIHPTLAYEKRQILDNALKAIDHAVFFGPGSVVVFDSVSLNISGDNRYQEGDVDGAIEEYLIALEMDPSNVNVHNSLGVCYGILGSYDRAMQSFRTAAELDSKEVMAVYNAGLVQILMGNPDNALDYFQKARRIGPDVFEVAFQMGKCHLDSEHYQQARTYFEDAARIKPDSAPAWSHLGECYAAMEITNQAIQAYKTAIKKNPEDATALSGLGYLYHLQDKNTEVATMFCEQSVDLSPGNGLFHHRLGRLYLEQSRLNDALKAFASADKLGYNSKPFIDEIQSRQDVVG